MLYLFVHPNGSTPVTGSDLIVRLLIVAAALGAIALLAAVVVRVRRC